MFRKLLYQAATIICLCSLYLMALAGFSQAADLAVDGTRRFQTIDGFGVNANSERWIGTELIPAIDALIDTMGATNWRVVVESEENWETTNDNADPSAFNWVYYNVLYETTKFQRLWGILGYLNQKNVNNIMLSVMGCLPSWMGNCTLSSSQEDEWVEMVTSLLYYARNTKGLRIDILDPVNEPDISNEGPSMGVTQYIRILKKLITRMDALGLGDIQVIGPTLASVGTGRDTWMPAMLAESQIMGKVRHFGFHSYSGDSSGIDSAIKASAYSDRNFWMTEYSAWCSVCDSGGHISDYWSFGGTTFDYTYSHLSQNAASAQIWEGYDSIYEHYPGTWSYWGLMAYNAGPPVTYTPTKRMYISAHIFKYVQPGAVRIAATTSQSGLNILAFTHPTTGRLTIVGRNDNSTALTLQGTLTGVSPVTALEFYQTTRTTNFARGADVSVTNNAFSVQLPADSFFTLTSASGSPGPQPSPGPNQNSSASGGGGGSGGCFINTTADGHFR